MCGSAVMVCMLSRRQVPGSQLFSFQIGHQGLITGTHPLGTNYLPEVAEGYFVTELKPLEVVGHRSVVGGKNTIDPISRLPRLVGLGGMESGCEEWRG